MVGEGPCRGHPPCTAQCLYYSNIKKTDPDPAQLIRSRIRNTVEQNLSAKIFAGCAAQAGGAVPPGDGEA